MGEGDPGPTGATGLPRGANALLEAVIAISSDLDMHSVLDRIVVSSCELTGARYGALGVIGADGQLADFITHGIDDELHRKIGDLPRGRGILRLIIDHPEPLRLERLQSHPASYGFPPHHPPMTSFLGVPVRIRGTVFGNLYLTEKQGGGGFTEDDETLVQALASAAGFVIENARAYAVSERQRAWLEASSRLNDAMQPPAGLDDSLKHIAVGTRSASGALAVAVLAADDNGDLVVQARDGRQADLLPGLIEELDDEIRLAAKGSQPDAVELDRARTAYVLPLRARLYGTGVLVVVVDAERSVPGLAAKEFELISSFADQAALSLDRLQALADRQELALLSDRDRIARDLHDVVIQRLFATGLQLQGIRGKAVRVDVQEKLAQAVEDLDNTIRDIRSTIFELRQGAGTSFRGDAQNLAHEYAPVLGFGPTLRTHGPVDTVVPPEVGEQALAVLREALSNVARHARASTTSIDLGVDGGELRLLVTDDGVGLPDQLEESGLRNVRRRAEDMGGAVRLERVEPHGTILEWRVPLPELSGDLPDGTTAGTSD